MKHVGAVQWFYVSASSSSHEQLPLARLVQVLQMQHLRGIHTYRVEASHAGLLGPHVQLRRERNDGWVGFVNPNQHAAPSLI